MGLHTLLVGPVSDLILAAPEDAEGWAEYIISDPEHVPGLLHRLAEFKGGFDVEQGGRPVPILLGTILSNLVDAVVENSRHAARHRRARRGWGARARACEL